MKEKHSSQTSRKPRKPGSVENEAENAIDSVPSDPDADTSPPGAGDPGERPAQPVEALLAHFTTAGIGRAFGQSGFTADEAARIALEIANDPKTRGSDRLAALRELRDWAQFALRRERHLSLDTRRTWELTQPASNQFRLEYSEQDMADLSRSVQETERSLQEAVGAAPQLPAPSPPNAGDDDDIPAAYDFDDPNQPLP